MNSPAHHLSKTKQKNYHYSPMHTLPLYSLWLCLNHPYTRLTNYFKKQVNKAFVVNRKSNHYLKNYLCDKNQF